MPDIPAGKMISAMFSEGIEGSRDRGNERNHLTLGHWRSRDRGIEGSRDRGIEGSRDRGNERNQLSLGHSATVSRESQRSKGLFLHWIPWPLGHFSTAWKHGIRCQRAPQHLVQAGERPVSDIQDLNLLYFSPCHVVMNGSSKRFPIESEKHLVVITQSPFEAS